MTSEDSPDCKFRYLLADGTSDDGENVISTVGYQNVEPGGEYPIAKHPHRYIFDVKKGRFLDEYQLIYISHGEGVLTDRQGDHEINAGTLFLLRPEYWHAYRPNPASGWTEHYIGFKGDGFTETIERFFPITESNIFRIGIREELVGLYREALQCADSDYFLVQSLLCAIVQHMLMLLKYHLSCPEGNDSLAQKAIDYTKTYILDKLSQKISFEQIADNLGMSYSWLRKTFKDYAGMPPAKYLQSMRLQKAKYFLINTRVPVKEIALKCGFATPEYFCNVFKEATGVSPNNFRDAHKDNEI